MTDVSAASRRVAALFDQVAPTYEAVGVPWFTPIAQRMVAEVDPRIGAHVLDVGCGRGAAIPALAAAVGPIGRVVGIDLSPRMVENAKHAVERRGLHNVELHVMDAATPDFPRSSFNVVVSSLVLFLLPDPAAALRSWHDVLVPTGQLGITSFAERDPEWLEVDALFAQHLPADFIDARTTGANGPFASDRGVETLVAAAGFDHVHTVRWNVPVSFDDVAHWRLWSMSHGQRGMWLRVPADDRDELERQAGEILQRRRTGDGRIELNQTVRLTLASRRY